MRQTFYNEDTTDEWSIRSNGYSEYPGWTWLTVLQRPTGIMIFSGTVRDGQVATTALLAVKRHEDMQRDRVTTRVCANCGMKETDIDGKPTIGGTSGWCVSHPVRPSNGHFWVST